MHDITNLPQKRNELPHLRRHAKKRGFRILRDWAGNYSLVDTRVNPQRSLTGLSHVPLGTIGDALVTPLPPPKIRVARTAVKPRPGLAPITIVELTASPSSNGGAA